MKSFNKIGYSIILRVSNTSVYNLCISFLGLLGDNPLEIYLIKSDFISEVSLRSLTNLFAEIGSKNITSFFISIIIKSSISFLLSIILISSFIMTVELEFSIFLEIFLSSIQILKSINEKTSSYLLKS
ncbi:hypothetical protein [Carp edema virus]|nr:hypothetical protein [Carp edema virus]